MAATGADLARAAAAAARRFRLRRADARRPLVALRLASAAPLAAEQIEAIAAALYAAGRQRCVVCNCFDVSEDEIGREARAGKSLPEMQQKLKCGTSCGTCLTEVRRMDDGLAPS